MKTIHVFCVAGIAYAVGYLFGMNHWHPKPITEPFHLNASQEIFHITSYGRLVAKDSRLIAALEKETTIAAQEAINCWMLLDLELHYSGKNKTNGERALIVADRMKFTPDPSWKSTAEPKH